MKSLILAALLAVPAVPVWAGAGAEPFSFLQLDANARPVAMGGAYTALASDANALLYNPAGLGWMTRHEATFMHNEYFEGVTQEYAAFAARQGFGANLTYASLAGVPKTTVSNPDGTGLPATGLKDFAGSVGYGYRVFKSMSLGAGAKYIRSAIDGVVSHGYALDIGALYSLEQVPGLWIGGSVQNLGPAVKFQGADEDLPMTVRAGSAYKFKAGGQDCVASLDVSKERNESVVVGVGGEATLMDRFPVRAGYTSRPDSGPGVTAGFGYQHRNFSVDYAFAYYGSMGLGHRISGTVRWGGAGAAAPGRPDSRSSRSSKRKFVWPDETAPAD